MVLTPLEARRWQAEHDARLDCDGDQLQARRAQREADRKHMEADRRWYRQQSLSPVGKAKLEARRAERDDADHAQWSAAVEVAEREWGAIEAAFRATHYDDTLSDAEADAALVGYERALADWHQRNDDLFPPKKAAMTNVLAFPAVATASRQFSLPLTFFDQCTSPKPKRWLIKGVLAEGENSSIFGPPGSLKSALLTDLGVHLASGRDWRGFKIKERRGVVFFAFERADQMRRRLAAYAKRDQVQNAPIAIASDMLDMLNPGCVDVIAATVREAERNFGLPVGLIVFDTLNKALAAGGGDENSARDQNLLAANLRRVHAELGRVHVVGIGHSGKDPTRGERGSNARQGDVDLEIQISGDEIKTATVTKANDAPEGPLTAFRGEVVNLGEDEDGDPISAFILSAAACPSAPKIAKLSDKAALALEALRRAINDHGENGAVSVEAWRDELFASGVLDRDAGNPRSAFKRLRDSLVRANRISERDGIIRMEFGQRLPMTPEIPTPPKTNNL